MFEDTWHWNIAAEVVYNEPIKEPDQVGRMIESFRAFIGNNQMMAYLVMMAVRLKKLYRILKPTGSLYLHCDPTASRHSMPLLGKMKIGRLNTNGQNYTSRRHPNPMSTLLS